LFAAAKIKCRFPICVAVVFSLLFLMKPPALLGDAVSSVSVSVVFVSAAPED
jgi:hypothetical protein